MLINVNHIALNSDNWSTSCFNRAVQNKDVYFAYN